MDLWTRENHARTHARTHAHITRPLASTHSYTAVAADRIAFSANSWNHIKLEIFLDQSAFCSAVIHSRSLLYKPDELTSSCLPFFSNEKWFSRQYVSCCNYASRFSSLPQSRVRGFAIVSQSLTCYKAQTARMNFWNQLHGHTRTPHAVVRAWAAKRQSHDSDGARHERATEYGSSGDGCREMIAAAMAASAADDGSIGARRRERTNAPPPHNRLVSVVRRTFPFLPPTGVFLYFFLCLVRCLCILPFRSVAGQIDQ
jgi:hypothetical protein